MQEKIVKNEMGKELNGRLEVRLTSGIADIITNTHVWEVKHFYAWKQGLGQVTIYASECGLRPGLILYGREISKEKLDIIKNSLLERKIDLIIKIGQIIEENETHSETKMDSNCPVCGRSGSGLHWRYTKIVKSNPLKQYPYFNHPIGIQFYMEKPKNWCYVCQDLVIDLMEEPRFVSEIMIHEFENFIIEQEISLILNNESKFSNREKIEKNLVKLEQFRENNKKIEELSNGTPLNFMCRVAQLSNSEEEE